LNIDNLARVEAMLFVSEEPISLLDLADAVQISKSEIKECLEVLRTEYDKESHGIALKEYNGRYIFKTKAIYAPFIEKYYEKTQEVRLSRAALETLAIIAYKQPVTRNEIEEIRGVKAEKTLLTLTKYDLIKELGRKETIGNPIVYGTTDEFLHHFDIINLSQLPELEEVE
jgi:segregation and condensation protein B